MKIDKIIMYEMETFIRKSIHYAIQELETSDDFHQKAIEILIKSVRSKENLEIDCFKHYINNFDNCTNLKYLSEVSIEGVLARAIEISQFILYKPAIKFAIKISDGKIEMIDTIIDPFFIKRSFSTIIDEKCRASTFPVYISENAFHYLDRINKEHIPHDPGYFDSYGINLFYHVLDCIKNNDEYSNIQYEKEEIRRSLIKEICKKLDREASGVDIAALDFFIKKIKGG